MWNSILTTFRPLTLDFLIIKLYISKQLKVKHVFFHKSYTMNVDFHNFSYDYLFLLENNRASNVLPFLDFGSGKEYHEWSYGKLYLTFNNFSALILYHSVSLFHINCDRISIFLFRNVGGHMKTQSCTRGQWGIKASNGLVTKLKENG